MIFAVLKVKLTLNSVNSSWGYIKNLKMVRADNDDFKNPEEASKKDVLRKSDLITIYYMTVKYIEYEF
jgi:hypothetical protein